MSNLDFKIFNSAEQRNKALREDLLDSLSSSYKFNLALSGGSTPISFFDYMQSNPLNATKHWNVFWVDERMVSSTDERSNAKYPISTWIKNETKAKSFPVDTSLSTAEQSTINYRLVLESECESQLDYIILGMGSDGHTASIFPANEESNDSVFWCNHPTDGTQRISMNYNLLAKAKKLVLLIQGKQKRKILEETSLDLPIHKLLKKTKIVCYYID